MAGLLPRVGIGVDVHPIAAGRPLYLAGLLWPGEDGLTGHSDGDVAAHAACSALLSAAGLGDLGSQFGTDRPEWAGASGAALLAETAEADRCRRVTDRERGHPGHLQSAANLGPARRGRAGTRGGARRRPVSLAATTSDGLGLTGRGEGIAAIATALLALAS